MLKRTMIFVPCTSTVGMLSMVQVNTRRNTGEEEDGDC